RYGAFPEGVHTATIEIFPMTFVIFLRGEGLAPRQLLPNPRRLIWKHARTTNPAVKQAAHSKGVVAHHLRRETEARPPGQQPILRTLSQKISAHFRRLPVCRRSHDQPL